MLIRSKAPLRLGLAGGGTDVSPYSDRYGGVILNATIDLYAYATLKPTKSRRIVIQATDRGEKEILQSAKKLSIDDGLDLAKGVYNRIVKDFTKKPLSFELTTWVDAPGGSGLGTSSTLVVAIVGAFVEWLKLPLGEYDIAHLAYQIEREDIGIHGGKQDQYAATFGGVNFMEFVDTNRVIVNPLRIQKKYLDELNHNLILFSTNTSRKSADIILRQIESVKKNKRPSIQAMHSLKEEAQSMKEALLKGDIDSVGKILHYGWEHKKAMAKEISNSKIDEIYKAARSAGATGGKVTGAGGGGFMILYAPGTSKFKVMKALSHFEGQITKYNFVQDGLTSWTV